MVRMRPVLSGTPRGSGAARDQASVVGRTVYLRTPDGLGRSELAAQLARSNPAAQDRGGTARNWATITKLLAMLDA
jgi:uncharacterized protein (DUF1697 family)